jgi:hypothetical protein
MDSKFPEDTQAPPQDDPFAQQTVPTGWLAAPALPQTAPVSTTARPFDFRPLTAGEILDRTFAVYRSRFWLFAGIGGIAGAARTVLSAMQMLSGHFMRPKMLGHRFDITAIILGIVVGIASLFFVSLGLAASTYAVGEIYLGHEVSIGSSWKSVGPRWLAYTGIFLWQLGSFIWIPFLTFVPGMIILFAVPGSAKNPVMVGIAAVVMILGGLGGTVGGIILVIRNLLAVPAAVIEDLKVRPSMRRSKVLAAGAKGRIFLVGIIYYCLLMVVGAAQAPFAVMMMLAISKGKEAVGSEIGTLLIGFIGSSLVMPVFMIGLTIIYFDQRIRKEAFDIAMMLEQEPGTIAPAQAAEFGSAEPPTTSISEA